MIQITNKQIEECNISCAQSIEWVREAFLRKGEAQLPHKISLHPRGDDFINTMPCILPEEFHRFSCKIVSRVKGRKPALSSYLLLQDTDTGELLAMMDADWITARRTGAVAALAIKTLESSDASVYAFMGLGCMAYETFSCLMELKRDIPITVRLLRYKDQAEAFIKSFDEYKNVTWEIVDGTDALVCGADVIVSCITTADGLIVNDVNMFKPGVLVVPVHTRGFQNCDTIFDKVFADDEGHVMGFRYFNEFRKFGEIGDVLSGKIAGRESNQERILSYNIGLGLHDAWYASHIYDMLQKHQ